MKLNLENAIIFWRYVVKILALRLLWNWTMKTPQIFWRFEVQILVYGLHEIDPWLDREKLGALNQALNGSPQSVSCMVHFGCNSFVGYNIMAIVLWPSYLGKIADLSTIGKVQYVHLKAPLYWQQSVYFHAFFIVFNHANICSSMQ